ncbi:TonB-dependent receptor plug domain-containing protein [Tellurirhabdus bombi]|uniref:TonB-dependent receptor plug domain-containing protein n=1 Tax=Tellurirhabdus bombi TaxID=2907205 RepID=UPI001F15D620|nr:TonB-dependent receptor plug domain-containing protein [Tellurirhabdus bombi]
MAYQWVNNDFPKRLIERLFAFHQTYPKEKVYLHTDRPYYAAGETIWLKGYLFDGITHRSDSVSRTLYVDLVHLETQKVIIHKILRAENGYAPGDLQLPDSLLAGAYLLRSYTGWMRNFSEEDFFNKPVTILRTDEGELSAGLTSAAVETIRPDLQFFPEGGQLIQGLDNRIGFKAIGPNGKGLDVEGFVLNPAGDTLTGFASMHLGMGSFNLTPEAGKKYTAYLKFPDGRKFDYPIPPAQAEGFSMLVDNLSNRENVRVFIRNNKAAGAQGLFTLVAQTRGQVVHIAQGDVTKKSFIAPIPRNKVSEGITQLTLFDETNRPVCERVIFIDQNERLTVSIKPTKTVYAPREKMQFDIAVTNEEGTPVRANLSLAAIDTKQVLEKEPYATTINSYLTLTSDLRGAIEQPGYYIDPKNTDRHGKLDLLMLTQGWRRFTWQDVLQDSYAPTKYPIEQGLSITGQVARLNQKTPGQVKLTFMFSRPDSTRDFMIGESDEFGKFRLDNLNFADSTNVLIQSTTQKGNRNLTIKLDDLLNQPVRLIKIPYNPVLFQRDELAEYLKRTREYLEIERQIRRNREVLLKAFTIKKKREEPRDSRKIYGSADATIKLDLMNSAGALTVLDVLRGRVAGVTVTGNSLDPVVQIRGAANFQGVVEPLFLLDGVPVDKSTITSIAVTDVESIDVLKGASAAIFGSRSAGGAIAIFTKRGAPDYDFSKDPTPGTLITKLQGYSKLRKFYVPKYGEDNPENRRPDFRPTLFWSPMITTDSEGKASVSFFASDARTRIRVQAEGATSDGLPGVGLANVEVK